MSVKTQVTHGEIFRNKPILLNYHNDMLTIHFKTLKLSTLVHNRPNCFLRQPKLVVKKENFKFRFAPQCTKIKACLRHLIRTKREA